MKRLRVITLYLLARSGEPSTIQGAISLFVLVGGWLLGTDLIPPDKQTDPAYQAGLVASVTAVAKVVSDVVKILLPEDWRADISKSADELLAELKQEAGGKYE